MLAALFCFVLFLSTQVAMLSPAEAAAVATLPVSAIAVGAHGECMTVLHGERIEPLPFEVRGVLPGYLGPKRDLIVIRLLGETAEFTGVAQGMSGSPCLIDGKVIGALSYSLAQFNKEPVAGVTPMADMLAVFDIPRAALPWRRLPAERGANAALQAGGAGQDLAAQASAPRPARPTPEQETADWQALSEGRPSPLAAALPPGVQPIGVPLSLAGMDPTRLQHWQPYFASQGLHLGPGASDGLGRIARTAGRTPSSGTRDRASAKAKTGAGKPALEAGGSVAAILVHGDVDMAGTGTVSWVDGDRVLAFGHPFFGIGPISAPMATARIVQVLASTQLSRKLPVTGDIVGEFFHDRLPGIAGTLGARPAMVAVDGKVAIGASHESFHFDVSRDGFWTPRFLLMALDAAISGRAEAGAHGTLHLSGTLAVSGLPPLVIHNVVAASRNPSLALQAALPLAQAFATLWRTEQEEPPQDVSLRLEATFTEALLDERILAVHAATAVAAPGEQLAIAVELGQPEAPPRLVPLRIEVPQCQHGEQLRIVACDAAQADDLEARLGTGGGGAFSEIGGGLMPELQLPRRDQRYRHLSSRRVPGRLYVLLVRESGRTRQAHGESYAGLPPTSGALFAGMESQEGHGGALIGPAVQVARTGVVRGRAEHTLQVERPFGTVPAQSYDHALTR